MKAQKHWIGCDMVMVKTIKYSILTISHSFLSCFARLTYGLPMHFPSMWQLGCSTMWHWTEIKDHVATGIKDNVATRIKDNVATRIKNNVATRIKNNVAIGMQPGVRGRSPRQALNPCCRHSEAKRSHAEGMGSRLVLFNIINCISKPWFLVITSHNMGLLKQIKT